MYQVSHYFSITLAGVYLIINTKTVESVYSKTKTLPIIFTVFVCYGLLCKGLKLKIMAFSQISVPEAAPFRKKIIAFTLMSVMIC